jgi:flagellum-specific peptidoglycan hydrolase FlgJ
MSYNNHYTRAGADYQSKPPSPDRIDTLWKLMLIVAVSYIVWNDIKLSESVTRALDKMASTDSKRNAKLTQAALVSFDEAKPLDYGVTLPKTAKSAIAFAMDPGFAERYNISEAEVAAAMQKLKAYTDQYAPVAVSEMHTYGIPASVTLAQGLLESGVGGSKLAGQARNHFGIKCFSRSCGRGHCLNFTDDTHKDFFVKYKNVWQSYRAHSQLLKGNARYKPLFQLDENDFAGWAHGLSKHGYATDPKYAQKIIAIIKVLGLDRYDRA